jgi:hypothetical protein
MPRFSGVPAVPSTRSPYAAASWTAAVPTPPPAPRMRMLSPGRTRAASNMQTQAVRKTTGIAAASVGLSESGQENS